MLRVRGSYIPHLVNAGSALWKMTQVFLAVGPEGCAGSSLCSPSLAAGKRCCWQGPESLFFPFSQLLLVMKMGMFPRQLSAGTALSRADHMGSFFLFPSPDRSHSFGYVLSWQSTALPCSSSSHDTQEREAVGCGRGMFVPGLRSIQFLSQFSS